jgi:hypothetical protein
MTPAECLASIRAYTQQHEELKQAHHFLFDLPVTNQTGPVDVVLMGMNPGESTSDFDLCPAGAEESREHDFHQSVGPGRSHIRWHQSLEGTFTDVHVVQTEAFFWSCAETGEEFKGRFGTAIDASPHIPFCSEMNRHLIQHHSPKLVVVNGITMTGWLPQHFGLRLLERQPLPKPHSGRKSRAWERYTDGQRPWLFVKHATGARRTREESLLIKRTIQDALDA